MFGAYGISNAAFGYNSFAAYGALAERQALGIANGGYYNNLAGCVGCMRGCGCC